MRRQGWLWWLVLLAMPCPSPALARTGEVSVETRFDDAAAYPALRLIDGDLAEAGRFPAGELDPMPLDEPTSIDDDAGLFFEPEFYEVQVLPSGLMYQSYLAGEKEPRIQGIFLSEKKRGLVWETQVGGRVGLLRYGTRGAINPEGWQWDLEGGAQVRIDPREKSDVEAIDFRVGTLITRRIGPDAFKFGYYHLSSHVGDEFLDKNPGFVRINYVRDSAIFGWMHDLTDDTQLYGEVAYAVGRSGGAKPLEFQYGFQYAPREAFGFRGAPFFAVNGHTRQDLGWITGFNTVGGWLWRGEQTNHTFRIGLQYYTGPSLQWSFVGQDESLIGGGLWFDY